jgi:maltooligosyltrehalose trehalohydrolase
MASRNFKRRLPVGAEVQPDGGTSFRVWCPDHQQISLSLENSREGNTSIPLHAEADGYFSLHLAEAKPGMRYRYVLDGDAYPDPASRFQPDGPHGASQIVDAASFPWTDQHWKGVKQEGQVIYEMHVGTFTREGTWLAAMEQLPALVDLGVTVLELMPVADFTGSRGWGYDGVNLFAPTRLYGKPDDFRRFVNEAHHLGIGVILDVVYNHLGPDGNYLGLFSKSFFSSKHKCEWGDAINFDGPGSEGVREHFLANAGYWIEEFHLDGLRLDATDQIFDDSPENIIAAVAKRVREAAPSRKTYLVGENEAQRSILVRPASQGGYELNALWNDDYHHSAIVAMTGRNEAYYTDYFGTAQEMISLSKWGYLYQGQYYSWQKKNRGTPCFDLPHARFVTFIQNHDQVANSLWGKRIHTLTSAARVRAMTAFLLLGPGTPMLFQGQEFASSAPFLYFADHEPELAKAVLKGRHEFLSQFPSIASPEAAAVLSNPNDEETFLRCKLDFSEREKHAEIYRLHRDLIRLRKATPLFLVAKRGEYDGAVLGKGAFLLRFFGRCQDDRLLIVNLAKNFSLGVLSEPLLAPPDGHRWDTLWSSEDPKYGGSGHAPVVTTASWQIPAEAAVVLSPQPLD